MMKKGRRTSHEYYKSVVWDMKVSYYKSDIWDIKTDMKTVDGKD